MTRGRPVAAFAVALVIVALAGCSGTSKPAPAPASSSDDYAWRLIDAPALLVQCALSSGALKPQPDQSWYSHGKVLPLSGSGSSVRAADMSSWWDANSGAVVNGKALSGWQQWAAQNDAMPLQVCGPSVSASSLQAKIYPGLYDPWTT